MSVSKINAHPIDSHRIHNLPAIHNNCHLVSSGYMRRVMPQLPSVLKSKRYRVAHRNFQPGLVSLKSVFPQKLPIDDFVILCRSDQRLEPNLRSGLVLQGKRNERRSSPIVLIITCNITFFNNFPISL